MELLCVKFATDAPYISFRVGWAAHQMNPTGNFIADSRFRLTEANLGLQTGQPGFDSSYDRGVDDDNSSLSSISIDPQLRQSSSQNPSDDINFGGLKISQNTPLDDHNNTNFNMLSASVHFNYFVDKVNKDYGCEYFVLMLF